MKNLEIALERLMFASRWLLAPIYLGLVGSLLVLLANFSLEFWHLLEKLFSAKSSEIIVGILSLVDMALVANLLLIIIFSGYENFVSKIHCAEHEDRPEWMGKVDFSDLKIKLIGSIVAISGIELLKAFVSVADLTNEQLAWKVAIHLVFVLSGVLFALMDKLTHGKKH
ncbi:TIGR00645 family protein [Balneatrix alpica]|nr:TIGR00645 family protein [Balneatrix alpica]